MSRHNIPLLLAKRDTVSYHHASSALSSHFFWATRRQHTPLDSVSSSTRRAAVCGGQKDSLLDISSTRASALAFGFMAALTLNLLNLF